MAKCCFVIQRQYSYAKRIQYASTLLDQVLITIFSTCRRAEGRKIRKVKTKYLILADVFHKIKYYNELQPKTFYLLPMQENIFIEGDVIQLTLIL